MLIQNKYVFIEKLFLETWNEEQEAAGSSYALFTKVFHSLIMEC